MSFLLRLEQQAPALMAAFAAVIYAFTLSPTISHTDAGELTAVCYTFGVAHPTGYPLFTLLGGLFAHIPLGSPALMLNIFCMLLTAGGVYWWGRALDLFFTNMKAKAKDGDHETAFRIRMARLMGLLAGGLFLAFNRTWWMQATSAEVYALHAFLLTLNLFLLLRAWYAPRDTHRPWLWLAFGLALGFANHLTTLVLLPGIAWLYFRANGFQVPAWKRLGLMLAVFFPILIALYAWLPLRAGMDPQYAWGNPVGGEEIYHHMSGKQFSVWMFKGSKVFQENLGVFLKAVPVEFGFGALVLLIPGLWYGFKLRRDESIFFLLCFAACAFWASNYDIKDPEPYFLLAIVALTFWMGLGMRWVWLRMQAAKGARWGLTALAGAMLVFTIVWNHYPTNQRGTWQYVDYTRAALNSLPQDALVLSKAWDVFVSPAYYVQSVEGVRPDVKVIEYNMLHDRHWYPDHLRRNVPEVAGALGPKLDEWEKAVQDFDLRDKMDPVLLSRTFNAVFYGILAETSRRPVYLSPEVKDIVMNPAMGTPLPAGWALRPEHYFYRLVTQGDFMQYVPLEARNDVIRLPNELKEPEDMGLVSLIADTWEVRARYEEQFGYRAEADALRAKLAGLPKRDARLAP